MNDDSSKIAAGNQDSLPDPRPVAELSARDQRSVFVSTPEPSQPRHVETRDIIGSYGTPVGDAGFGIHLRKGLQFNGTGQYVDCSNEQGLSFAALRHFTFEAWVHPSAKGPRGGVLLSKLHQHTEGTWYGEYVLGIDPDGRVYFKWKGARGTATETPDNDKENPLNSATSLETVRTDTCLPFEEFSHIAVTYDGALLKIYLRGEEAAGADTLMGPTSEAPVMIGAFLKDTTPEEGFNGILDELRIWNVCRTEDLLRRTRHHILDAGAEGLVSCWRFREGVGDRTHAVGSCLCEGVFARGRGQGGEAAQPIWAPPELWITRGRCYVEGFLCENEREIRFTQQPDAPGLALPKTAGFYEAYLDVWERTDGAIHTDTALQLHISDATKSPSQTVVAQVKLLPEAEAQRQQRAFRLKGRMTAWRQLAERLTEDQQYRVEIHHSGGLYGVPLNETIEPVWEVSRIIETSTEIKQLAFNSWKGRASEWEAGQYIEIFQTTRRGEELGILGHVTAVDRAARMIEIEVILGSWDASDGPWSLRRIASFKWTRDNAPEVFTVTALEATEVVLAPCEQTPQIGDWMEPANATIPIEPALPLRRVAATTVQQDGSIRVRLDGPLAKALEKPSFLKCWQENQEGTLPAQGTIPLQKGAWQLEHGIHISFEGDGGYLAGDYWILYGRAATQDIEWPRQASGLLLPRPPMGITHRYAPLARLHMTEGVGFEVCEDLRKGFAPLTAPALLPSTSEAITEKEVTDDNQEDPISESFADSSTDTRTQQGSTILEPLITPPPGYRYTGTLVIGRYQETSWKTGTALPEGGRVLAIILKGQLYALTESGHLWAYDPQADTDAETHPWVRKEGIPKLRKGYSICVLENCLYVIGGYEASGQKTGLNEVYDPINDEWVSKTPLLTARSELSVVAAAGKIFAIGGNRKGSLPFCNDTPTALVEVYDPKTDSWSQRMSMPEAKSDFTAAVLYDQIYCIGGQRKRAFGCINSGLSASHFAYSVTTGRWRIEPGLERARSSMSLAVVNEKFYIAGGKTQHGAISQVEVYDPHMRMWYTERPLRQPRYGLGLAAHNGVLYAIGGKANNQNVTSMETLQLFRPLYVHCRDQDS